MSAKTGTTSLLFLAAALAAPALPAQKAWAEAKGALVRVLTGGDRQELQTHGPTLVKHWSKTAELLAGLRERGMALAAKVAAAEGRPDKDAVKEAVLGLRAMILGEAEGEAKLMASPAAAKAALTGFGRAVDGWVRIMVLQAVQIAQRSGARYAGQYTKLTKLGPNVVELLISMVENPPQRVTDPMRATLLSAVRDVTKTLSADHKKRILELADDEFEDENVQAMADYVLYHVGDQERVLKRIAKLEAATKDENKKLRAYQQLAELSWQVREYGKAVAAYRALIALAANFPDAQLGTLHYNMCCSQSLAGDIDGALATLDKALAKGSNLSDNLLRVDHDISALRKDKRFWELMKKHGRDLKREGSDKGEEIEKKKKEAEAKKKV